MQAWNSLVIVGAVILRDSCMIRCRIPVMPGALSRYSPLIACLILSIVIGSCTKGSGYSYPSWSDRSGSGGLGKNWYCRYHSQKQEEEELELCLLYKILS